jgi:gluconokinase
VTNPNSITLVAVDVGTTHAKAVLYRHGSGIECQQTASYATAHPRPGHVEQDAAEILAAVEEAIRRLVERSGVSPGSVDAIVFDGVWQSLLPVDREGNALLPASIWADTRSLAQTEHLKGSLDTEEVRRRTGCPLHPMYFLPRLAWLREHAPEVFARADRFVSIKEYVVQHLFGGRMVDRSTASGTGVWNMSTLDWDGDLLSTIGLTPSRFSRCVEPTELFPGLQPAAASRLGLRAGTPCVVGASDGALSHLGSVGLADGRMSLTVGTGAALRRRLSSPQVSDGSEAWCYYLAEGNWLLGGVLHDAGNALRWFAETLMPPGAGIEVVIGEMNRLCEEAPVGAEGLLLLPLFSGERCPHDRPQARGAMYGLTLAHSRGHLVRALMEGLAFNLFSVYRMLTSGADPDLVVTGGILKSRAWLQVVADVFGKTLWLPQVPEAATWGGVLVGLRALGVLPSLDACTPLVGFAGTVEPDPVRHDQYRDVFAKYQQLYADLFSTNHR